jgi:hypothetical protein
VQRYPVGTIALGLVLLCLVSGCTEAMAPSDQVPGTTDERTRLVIAIHGGGDDPQVWAEGALDEITAQLDEPERWHTLAYDWSEVADNRTSAAGRGLELGAEVAEDVLDARPPYEHLLIVAHSVGSFVAQGMIDRLDREEVAPTVHVVFLDPFGMRSITNRDYGEERFGEGADFAEAYINTDDATPSSSEALDHAYSIDVTGARPDSYDEDRWHWWPIDAWLEALERDEEVRRRIERAAEGEDLHEIYPRGDVHNW